MWEIFSCRTGEVVRRTRFRFIAFLVCHRHSGLDYAREGEGWI